MTKICKIMLDKSQTNLESLLENQDYSGSLAFLRESQIDKINNPSLNNGWEIVRERSAQMDKIVKSYFSNLIDDFTSRDKIVVVASGSYGRKELTPNSDNDITIITDIHAEKDSEPDYLIRMSIQPALRAGLFSSEVGYESLDTIPGLDMERVSSLMDMRYLIGDEDLFKDVRNSLKENLNLNRFIRYKIAELDSNNSKYPQDVNNVGKFEIKYGIGGLRQAMTGVWLEGSKEYEHSLDVYNRLPKDFVDSIGFLLKLRAWTSLKKTGSDLLTNQDFLDFKEQFGGNIAHRALLNSRKTIRNYVNDIRHQILERGVRVNDFIEFTESGLKVDIDSILRPPAEVFYTVMSLSQKENLPLSRSLKQVFERNAKKYIDPDERFLKLFYEEGSLYKSLRNLENMDLLDKFIPHFADLETEHYQRDHRNYEITRAEKALSNIERLEKLDEEIKTISPEDELENIRKIFIDQYKELSPKDKATLKFHLLTQDVPKITHQSTEEFYSKLSNIYQNSNLLNIPDLIFMNNHKRYLVDVVRTMLVNEDSIIESVSEEIGDLDKL